MELIKSQTKRINKFKKKLEKINDKGYYIYIYNIRNNKLWYDNRTPLCEISYEFLLKCSGLNWFNKINKYVVKNKMQEFKKALVRNWKLEKETNISQKAENLALLIEQETEHNKRVELIKELLEI